VRAQAGRPQTHQAEAGQGETGIRSAGAAISTRATAPSGQIADSEPAGPVTPPQTDPLVGRSDTPSGGGGCGSD